MSKQFHLTAIIEREDDTYVSLCPELDIASQGNTIEEARSNLKEAVELFFENASENEITDVQLAILDKREKNHLSGKSKSYKLSELKFEIFS